MTTVVRAYIGLGSNLAGPIEQVRSGMAALGDMAECRVVCESSLYRTTPVGFADQPDFINAVCAIDTTLSPPMLLTRLLTIEEAHGRRRTRRRDAPRTLDLDLLTYGDIELASPDLTLPHPRMHERAFVLVPLAEIAASLLVPGRGSVAEP